MLQELGKNNPQLLQIINQNQADFLRLINEPAGAGCLLCPALLFHLFLSPPLAKFNFFPHKRLCVL